jgi:hypothetical protein
MFTKKQEIKMSNEIQLHSNNMIIRSMDDAERAARAMASSGFFADSKSANQAVVKILAGQELGFGPFASMVGVQIIKEKPVLGANLIATAIKRSGKYNYKIVKHDENECSIMFYEFFNGKWEEAGTSRFTIDDAKKAGVFATNANWTKYPRNQLFARAISNGQRWYAPDAFSGAVVYTPDEMGATVDEDDNIISSPVVESPIVQDAPAHTMTVEEAFARLTPKGAIYGSLTIEQLETIANTAKLEDSRTAAELVLAHKRSQPAEEQPSEQEAPPLPF